MVQIASTIHSCTRLSPTSNRLLKNPAVPSELIPRHTAKKKAVRKDRSTTRLVERAGLVLLVPRRVYDIVESFYESTIRRIVDRPSAMKIVQAVADPSCSPPLEKRGGRLNIPSLLLRRGL